MDLRKQLLSDSELLKLMELQGELPRYQLEYSKLINAYLILERSLHKEVESTDDKSAQKVSKAENKVDSTNIKARIQKENTTLVEDSSHNKCEEPKKLLSENVLKEALGFLNDIDTSGNLKEKEYKNAVISKEAESTNINSEAKMNKVRKIGKDGHEYDSYLPKPFDGKEREEIIKLYLDGYSLVEIDSKLDLQINKSSQTIKTVDWYMSSLNNKLGNSNAIRSLTGKTKQNPDYILSKGVNDLASEFNVSPEIALHFINRARKYIDETL